MKPGETAPAIAANVDRRLLRQIDDLARKLGITRAALVRQAVETYVRQTERTA